MMTLLAIDPGSKVAGAAVFADGQLVDAIRVCPDRTRDLANDRIRTIVRELVALVDEHKPGRVVIEDTSGKVGRRRHKGHGAGLAVLGKAIGWLIGTLEARGVAVELITENVWTRRVSKRRRLQTIASRCRAYRSELDPGGDVGDAIGLGLWSIDQAKLTELTGGRVTGAARVWPPGPVRRRRLAEGVVCD